MTSWVRLWHDMPTDPKWRVIARKSGQRVGDVIAVFTFLLVSASANADERGRTQGVVCEDIAAALDLDDADVSAILGAMQGKVIDADGRLTGWEKRQPKREDNSAERAAAWRAERKRTQANAPERPDTDAETDKRVTNVTHIRASDEFDGFWSAYPVKKGKKPAHTAYLKALKETDHGTLVAAVIAQRRWPEWSDPGFIPHAATWLNRGGWTDEPRGSGGPSVVGKQNTGSGGRSDTSFADIAARRRREREAGMEIPGGQTGLHGGNHGWSDGAIAGEYSVGDCQAGSRDDAADARHGGTDGFAVAASLEPPLFK